MDGMDGVYFASKGHILRGVPIYSDKMVNH